MTVFQYEMPYVTYWISLLDKPELILLKLTTMFLMAEGANVRKMIDITPSPSPPILERRFLCCFRTAQ